MAILKLSVTVLLNFFILSLILFNEPKQSGDTDFVQNYYAIFGLSSGFGWPAFMHPSGIPSNYNVLLLVWFGENKIYFVIGKSCSVNLGL